MSTKKVSIEEMADAINEGLQEYADLAAEDMKAAVKKTATAVKKEISANAPVDTGAYAKSWTTKKTSEDSQSLQMTVYSKNRYYDKYAGTSSSASSGSASTSTVTEQTATDPAKSFTKSLAGTYKTTANLYMRNGAGQGKAAMVVLPKGTSVKNYGYYTAVSGVKWLYVQVTYNNIKYTGFCCGTYLKKQ